MEVVSIVMGIIIALSVSALCACGCLYLIGRHEREHKQWLRDLSQDYNHQWQEYETQHKGQFENEYWSAVVNKPEVLENGG